MSWPETLFQTLKNNEVWLVTNVAGNGLTPLIKDVISDNYFTSVKPPARRRD